MCTVLLPPDVNPIAVNKYIISKHINALCGQNVEILNAKYGGTQNDQVGSKGIMTRYLTRRTPGFLCQHSLATMFNKPDLMLEVQLRLSPKLKKFQYPQPYSVFEHLASPNSIPYASAVKERKDER